MTGNLTYRVRVSGSRGDIDRHVAPLAWVRLERRDGSVYLECRAVDAGVVGAMFARAGIRLEPAEPRLPVASVRPAIVSHLVAFERGDVHDVVTIRAISLGEALSSLAVARRWPFAGRHEDRRDRTRALLRGQDVGYTWRRTLFAPAAVLRARRLAGVRPVVFDRAALERVPERVGFAQDGALGAWVRA